MNQQRIGEFLKDLRRERGLTQEQFAEKMYVSNRTVSRWENGNNLPDMATLIEIADYFDVDLRELMDGERKSEKMDKQTKDTLLMAAEYSQYEMKNTKKKVLRFTIVAFILMLAALLLESAEGFGVMEIRMVNNIRCFFSGIAAGSILLNILYLSGMMDKICTYKMRLINKKTK